MADLAKFYRPWAVRERKTIAFSGAAGNGAVGTVLVFTVTGVIWLDWLTIFCTESLASGGAALVEVGVAADTDGLAAQITATDLDAGMWWPGVAGAVGTVAATGAGAAATHAACKVLNGANIIVTVTTAAVSDGTVVVDARYRPLSAGARMVGD